ncbi:MAG: FeS-binding protein [Chloroflexi bacterium]|nr:FeS-binding protein [Chloroflexota bacterium]
MASRRVKITFPEVLVGRPLIYKLGSMFDIVTSIRRADVGPETGWVILELQGEEEEIKKAVDWALEQGVRVDPITGDVIEG